jgi:hypothetical protein
MRQVVFNSPYQDEVAFLDPIVAGLTFSNGEPQTVTEEQAEILLRHPFITPHDAPNLYIPPAPIAPPEPEPPPAAEPDQHAEPVD